MAAPPLPVSARTVSSASSKHGHEVPARERPKRAVPASSSLPQIDLPAATPQALPESPSAGRSRHKHSKKHRRHTMLPISTQRLSQALALEAPEQSPPQPPRNPRHSIGPL